jgi:hypothetical protein
VPNPIEEAKKGFGWMSAKACELARVETPEDVKNRKKQEEREREEKEILERQKNLTPGDRAEVVVCMYIYIVCMYIFILYVCTFVLRPN